MQVEENKSNVEEASRIWKEIRLERNLPMTPLAIEICIHYYCSFSDFERLGAPVVDEIIKDLLERNILLPGDGSNQRYLGNREALQPYINAICSVHLPNMEWVAESGHTSFYSTKQFKFERSIY